MIELFPVSWDALTEMTMSEVKITEITEHEDGSATLQVSVTQRHLEPSLTWALCLIKTGLYWETDNDKTNE